jgi:hypothetical protein
MSELDAHVLVSCMTDISLELQHKGHLCVPCQQKHNVTVSASMLPAYQTQAVVTACPCLLGVAAVC